MILGAVLAGGKSTRFGSDKALAKLGARTLIEHAIAGLQPCCDEVIVVGRSDAPVRTIPDWPRPDCGPLAGVAAALREASRGGFASVITSGVDSFDLPGDLVSLLSPPPAFLDSQPVVGHWHADARTAAESILMSEGRHSMRAFAEMVCATSVKASSKPANINTPADLGAVESKHGL